MNTPLSPIAETARLETATETLAEYIGYLTSEIFAEEDKAEPNTGRIEALEHEREIVVDERHAITPDNIALINRALYVYAPRLKLMHG
ncbi:hypothetical protein LF887_09495 [Chryseobacterium sp. MEBOG06]|uniref:hypothetical protein n=1 Tax=Chryseobacterium sp. MEBOG06 TaxID=2879938 RepID=UPI001F2CA369|nr:hypothetical protein [Chryseobacterium sp. MEBOG06]UKB85835.1 hypothetical protein LF887_09495 [Chryseobacterium sp. MEBOG06]